MTHYGKFMEIMLYLKFNVALATLSSSKASFLLQKERDGMGFYTQYCRVALF